MQAEVLSLSASEHSLVYGHRGWDQHGDAKLDFNWVLYYCIRDGKIARCRTSPATQHATDPFCWEVWGASLKALSDRLSDA